MSLPHDWSMDPVPIPHAAGKTYYWFRREVTLPVELEGKDVVFYLANKREIVGPFDSYAIGGDKTGYTLGGTGWYRKHFALDVAGQGKKFEALFGGVYMNSDVWLNGQHLGERPYGYTSFYYDLTPHAQPPQHRTAEFRQRDTVQ